MILPQIQKEYIHKRLEQLRQPGELHNTHSVSGGDINEAYRLDYSNVSFFVKMNNADAYPGMFEKEASGLQLLSKHSDFKVPEVIEVNSHENQAFLLLEYLPSHAREKNSSFWEAFGRLLAKMHRVSKAQFGLDKANYIGKLPQSNKWQDSWPVFFAEERIMPQWQKARGKGYFNTADNRRVEALLQNLENWVPAEPPALVHGDLWSGNYLPFAERQPALIDPAVYYGHREMDLAMMHLFGGFAPELFSAYQEVYPLEQGWRDRLDIHNLYPLLVHVNLFGGGYAGEVERILKGF